PAMIWTIARGTARPDASVTTPVSCWGLEKNGERKSSGTTADNSTRASLQRAHALRKSAGRNAPAGDARAARYPGLRIVASFRPSRDAASQWLPCGCENPLPAYSGGTAWVLHPLRVTARSRPAHRGRPWPAIILESRAAQGRERRARRYRRKARQRRPPL